MTAKPKVVVASQILPLALEKIQAACEVQLWDQPTAIPRPLLFDWLKDAEGLLSSGSVRVDAELLSHAAKLRVIAQASVGYDNVDIEACTRGQIPFCNTPGVLVETMADLAFGLLLSAARRIHEGWVFVREGRWTQGSNLPFGIDLYGKTLGIVGMGQIGAAVAKRAQASGMRAIYSNRSRRQDEAELGVTYAKFDDLLAQSDFIIVLVPLTQESRGMFGAEQFARMKPTAYFINAARGAIADTDALYNALKNGEIAYAALDVTDPEPLPPGHPLLALPNLLITPHIGSATLETRTRMAMLAADNLVRGVTGERPQTMVNPEVWKEI